MTKDYDLELAKCLYLSGVTIVDIAKRPEFKGLHPQRLYELSSKEQWSAKKAVVQSEARAQALQKAAITLQERLIQAGIEHQEFVLDELRRERRVFSDRTKEEVTQVERLQILDKMDTIGRRLSRLDEQKESNPVTQGFAILVNLQTGQALNQPRELPLPSEQIAEHSKGILRSNNAHPDEAEEGEIVVLEEPGTDKRPMPPPGSLFGTTPIAPL